MSSFLTILSRNEDGDDGNENEWLLKSLKIWWRFDNNFAMIVSDDAQYCGAFCKNAYHSNSEQMLQDETVSKLPIVVHLNFGLLDPDSCVKFQKIRLQQKWVQAVKLVQLKNSWFF